jgi:hypothetical protein
MEVADVLYNAGQWYIAVNSGVTGTNRTEGQIYTYAGDATPTILSDETGVGNQRIGFLYRINGIIYVAYQDLSSTGFIIGYIAGSQIKPLGRFTGTLPNFQQKTLYKNTIMFLSSGLVYSAGALVDTLPFQLSQHADGGYATCGAIAAPFGTPMIASTDGGTNFRLAKFSGYDTACSWKSIVFPVSNARVKGIIDNVVVLTKTLGASARCDLTIEADQGAFTSSVKQITVLTNTTTKRKVVSNVATLTTASNHSYSVGDVVIISGVTDVTYNGTVTITATPSLTTFSYALTHANEAEVADTGGSVIQGKRKHIFTNFGLLAIEDFRVALDFSNGNATNDCAIRSIKVNGHFSDD